MKKRFFVCLILILLTALLPACKAPKGEQSGSDNGGNKSATKQVFTLMYCYNDSFNPYSANTKMNQELAYLLYDPLIKLDDNFKPVNYLADSVTTEGKATTVTLKQALFSDGSAVTADDVVYSIKAALNSNTRYKSQLEKIVSYTAANPSTVVINITDNDPYFVNMLDFPIIKLGSDQLKDENNLSLPPIGCGRYVLNLEKECLTANESHYIKVPEIKKIGLINTPDNEAMEYNLSTGAVSFYYSNLSDGKTVRMSGVSKSVNLNNIVYLGLNCAEGRIFSSNSLRLAVSAAINRTNIVNDAYYGNAQVANSTFHPSWNDAKSNQNAENTENIDVMLANLNDIGYNNKDNEGFYVNNVGKRLTFSVLCNSDNLWRTGAAELIVNQLNSYGIAAQVEVVDWNTYLARIASNNYDVYIGETSILNNMDISSLVNGNVGLPITTNTEPNNENQDVTPNQNVVEASPTTGTLSGQTVSAFYAGSLSIKDILAAFNSEMPIIPLCYRTGYVVYSQNITDEINSTVSDLFFGFENCKFK